MPTIQEVWRQKAIPVVHRPKQGEIQVKLPYSTGNRAWLREGHKGKPEWQAQFTCWKLPRAWLDDTVKRLLKRFGQLYLIQPHNAMEKCAPACLTAHGIECTCSCLGRNHGSHDLNGWYIISDACAVKWGEGSVRWQLVKPKPNT